MSWSSRNLECVFFLSYLRDAVSVGEHGFGAVVYADVVQDTHHYLFMSLTACSTEQTKILQLICMAYYGEKNIKVIGFCYGSMFIL